MFLAEGAANTVRKMVFHFTVVFEVSSFSDNPVKFGLPNIRIRSPNSIMMITNDNDHEEVRFEK